MLHSNIKMHYNTINYLVIQNIPTFMILVNISSAIRNKNLKIAYIIKPLFNFIL